MNHDIIAAGHPALRYEMATFHAWQPKHWRDSESEDKTFYEAQLWLAGQVAATDASLALLESRTANAHSVSEWPEFAAYNCASCHHNLGLDNSRSPFRENRKATAMYSQWNDSGIRWVANYRIETGQASSEDHELIHALDAVTAAMERRPAPSPHAVSATVSTARAVLAAWLEGQAGLQERSIFRSERLGLVIASAAGKRETFRTWESAVQFYLAAVAARESWPGGWNGDLKNVADRMRHGLRYPEMIDISRYSKRGGGHPTLNRFETMELGVELAGWLGQVQFEPMFEDDDEVTTQQMQDQLDRLIEQMDQRLEEIAEQRAKLDAKKAKEKKAKEDEKPEDEDEKKKPEVDRKSRDELRKELEAELKALEANSDGDE
jgi:mono/diheme cytochrome c family protein